MKDPKATEGRKPVQADEVDSPGSNAKAERLARQADELRRNLQRRKAQQRERRGQTS